MKAVVIGGGPSGIATLKFLKSAHRYFPIPPIEARLFESEDCIGGTFVRRTYEDGELVSSKYLTAFSDFRLPPETPDFVSPERYVQYLREYASYFDIWESIELGSRVISVSRTVGTPGHIVTVEKKNGERFDWPCDAVAICSGLNVHPRIPELKGLQRVPKVLHSSQFKGRDQFGVNTNVVILGAGETAMDVAHLSVTSPTKSTTICHKGGFFCAPKIIPVPRFLGRENHNVRPNKPVDTSVASLFDTAYVHPMLQRSRYPWIVYDVWIKNMHMLISGTEEGPDQWIGQMNKERKHVDAIFLCKSDRALPYISSGHRSHCWWNRLRSAILNTPIKDTNGRKIDVMGWPEGIGEDGLLIFEKSNSGNAETSVRPDVVVLATGYRTEFPFLGAGYPNINDADIRCVYRDGQVDVAFIGFVRPSIGAIPPLAELQAQFWIFRLLQHHYPSQIPKSFGQESLKSYDLDYKLHARAGYDLFATKRGVDHESYAYQLALDMGAAPTISFIISKGWKVFYTWAFGSNFNTKFRLVGPWKWEAGAEDIMANELFNVVKKTGGLVCE